MKTSMKFFASLVLMTGFAMSAMAQSATGTATATAKVIDVISVTKAQDLNFGQVSVGQNKSIDITGTVTGGANVSTALATVGKFEVYAGIGSNVQLAFTALPSNLSDGTNNMPIVYDANELNAAKDLAAYGKESDASDATRFTAATGVNVGSGTFPTNEMPNAKNGIYVFIGGTVKPIGTQARATYTGNITLTATYN